jgi:hypothetical protein
MIRKQIYMDEALDRGLKALAARTGKPEASHVREAVKEYLGRHLTRTDQDPLDALVGLIDDPGGPDDVAENHDRYLYGPGQDAV